MDGDDEGRVVAGKSETKCSIALMGIYRNQRTAGSKFLALIVERRQRLGSASLAAGNATRGVTLTCLTDML